MANTWSAINPPQIKLDTANDDGTYSAANDNYITSTGVKYSTQPFGIKRIEILDGANGDDVILQTLPSADLSSVATLIDWNLETGNLARSVDYNPPIWVMGLLPKTLDNSCKIHITLA